MLPNLELGWPNHLQNVDIYYLYTEMLKDMVLKIKLIQFLKNYIPKRR